MIRVQLDDFLLEYARSTRSARNTRGSKEENLKFVNIRGTGGSGKSTIINELLKYDSDAFEVFTKLEGSDRNVTVCTVFPNFKILALGHYHTACGGCDTFSKVTTMHLPQYPKLSDFYLDMLQRLDKVDLHIFMEGLMVSGIYEAYANVFKKLKETSKREVIIYTLLPPLSVCLERQKIRRGGKEVNPFHTVNKYKSIVRNTARFAKDFISIAVDSSKGDVDFNFTEFFRRVGIDLPDNYKDKFLSDEEW